MIELDISGSWESTTAWLQQMSQRQMFKQLSKYGEEGVAALSAATPTRTGLTGQSWSYEVITTSSSAEIIWKNSANDNGFPIAISLQYGYGTGTGGYVSGRDYINPAIKPVMDKIADDVWKAVIA